MNWKDSLGRHKFNSILFAATIEMTIGILMSLIDTGVSGHILGVRGLSAMNLIGPVTGFTIFTEGLFSVGTSMVYASYKGEYQVEKAETREEAKEAVEEMLEQVWRDIDGQRN